MPIKTMWGHKVSLEMAVHLVDAYRTFEVTREITIHKSDPYRDEMKSFMDALCKEHLYEVEEINTLWKETEVARYTVSLPWVGKEFFKQYEVDDSKWKTKYLEFEDATDVYRVTNSGLEARLLCIYMGDNIEGNIGYGGEYVALSQDVFPPDAGEAVEAILEQKFDKWLPYMLSTITGKDYGTCTKMPKVSNHRVNFTNDFTSRLQDLCDKQDKYIEALEKSKVQVKELISLIEDKGGEKKFKEWVKLEFKKEAIGLAPSWLDDPEYKTFAKYLLERGI